MGGWFALGLVAGLAVGALVVLALVRSTARITGASWRTLPRLVADGLVPGRTGGGIAAQRRLAQRVKRIGERTASGRRVAASALEVHVSPEDHAAIDEAMGVDAAQRDLLEFYTDHASRSGWLLGAQPAVSIVRDISLRPRQAFVRSETRLEAAPEPPPTTSPRPFVPPQGRPSVAPRTGPAPVAPRTGPVPDDAALTDVIPRGLGGEDAVATAAYPIGLAEHAAPGDLLVVHGTDVRVVPAARGLATVGRARRNDIVVDAPGVADDHLLLEHRQQQWWVVPGPSAARVSLEGRPLRRPEALQGQGLVELGRGARLRLSVEGGR
ncbi:FhaA domain-containing protein [Amnibacterium endophyticum]|uniref:FhaA domain-containing protein n=1 Tax=Amnibacterium endophyticum TaxID=2109337 RepID=A0ABW4LAV3_9MICO